MNDRELLELAAKAAGISGGWGDKLDYHNGEVDLTDYWVLDGEELYFWNPLIDDGDALRLAVSLRIEVAPENFSRSRVDARGPWGRWLWEMYDDHGGDAQKATRYAIVRVAAEIGRNMK